MPLRLETEKSEGNTCAAVQRSRAGPRNAIYFIWFHTIVKRKSYGKGCSTYNCQGHSQIWLDIKSRRVAASFTLLGNKLIKSQPNGNIKTKLKCHLTPQQQQQQDGRIMGQQKARQSLNPALANKRVVRAREMRPHLRSVLINYLSHAQAAKWAVGVYICH